MTTSFSVSWYTGHKTKQCLLLWREVTVHWCCARRAPRPLCCSGVVRCEDFVPCSLLLLSTTSAPTPVWFWSRSARSLRAIAASLLLSTTSATQRFFFFAENLQAGWRVSVMVLYVSCSAHDQRSVPNIVIVLEALSVFVFFALSIAFDRTFDVHVKSHLRNAQFGMF